MKKILWVTAAVLAVLAIGGAAWVVQAQSSTPQSPDSTFNCPGINGEGTFGRGFGMMGRGMMGGSRRGDVGGCGMTTGTGPMHEFMVNALAEAIGLTAEDINQKFADGQTMYQIASEAGLSDADIQELFTQAHADALQAYEDGEFEGDEAFQEHFEWMQENGMGTGAGCHGGGQGRWGASQN
ncbi:MAG: hypothetical protein CVU39_22260 [Chloroflexi bacterium HGW-Chloroflexi-10]|nr:MAG: hypothetical protein CVU39_22260 [Chloroflexi bacterium HGW-Chloroflexi-10]